jgi:hypothetical protein
VAIAIRFQGHTTPGCTSVAALDIRTLKNKLDGYWRRRWCAEDETSALGALAAVGCTAACLFELQLGLCC